MSGSVEPPFVNRDVKISRRVAEENIRRNHLGGGLGPEMLHCPQSLVTLRQTVAECRALWIT